MCPKSKNKTSIPSTEISISGIEELFNSIADPVIVHRVAGDKSPGRIVMCNDKTLEITGYSREEILKMDITVLGHPDSGLEDIETGEKLLRGKPLLFDRIIVRKDKTVFPVEVHARLIDYQGEKMVLASLRDISQRRKTEEETHLHLMFEKIVSKISSHFVIMPDHLIDKGIQRTLKEICEFLGAVRGGIFLLTKNGKGLRMSHEWCTDTELCNKPYARNFPGEGNNYCFSRLNKLENIVLDSQGDLPSVASGDKEWYNKHGFNPIFLVPIISEDRLAGAMGFTAEDNRSHHWPVQFGNLLRYIANVFYSALNRKEISQKLRLTQFGMDHNSEAVYWLSSPDYTILDVNPAACKSLGYKRDELIGMTVYDIDPLYSDEDGVLTTALQNKKSLTLETIHQKKNGKEFPVEIIANLIEFEGRDYVVSFARDITARKAAEDLLRKSEQEYRKIFENVVDIFYEASLDGVLLNVTPSVERITRYKRKDMIGKPMESFYHNPAVRSAFLEELFKKGEIRDYDLDLKDIDDSPVPCSLNSRIIFNDEGKPDCIVGSITDMRQRQKAEKQIRQLSTALQQSPVSVIITDLDTRILYINDSFARFSGMQAEELIGSTPYDITGGQVPLNNYNDLWDKVKEGEIWKGELEYLKRDGQKVWLSITVSPVLDDQDRINNFVAILEEITEWKTAEQTLRKAKEEAEKSDHLKSAFLANMSHEIRTPMNAILGFSSLLKEGDLDREQSNYYIDIINSKGRDLLRIISDIIDISRIEAGDLYIKMEPVQIFPFISEIFMEFKEDTQVKSRSNLQFRLKLPEPEIPAIVNTDPARLKQVFVNLIQNAIKFTPDGFVEVGFEMMNSRDIRFYVKDSGVGIPEDKIKIIFERFRQIDESHTREYGGTGLGLAICKNLLDLMGTELSLNTLEGQGSEFTFSMKYISLRPEDHIERQKKAVPGKPDLNLSGKKILIAEDDGSSYLFLESLLNRHSAEIIWAKSGIQAVDMVNRIKDIDLILMDIRMPEMNGIEATRKIRKKHPELPIIAQTAYAQATDRNLAIKSGCNDYLSKPISPVELTTLLRKYLNPGE